MKKCIACLLCCLSAYVTAQTRQPNPNHSLISTEVLPDNRVAFRIYAPAAKNVTLRSDDKWDKVEFKKDSRGVWEGIWSNVQPGAYRYRFVVDGVNVYDPKAPSARETKAIFMMTSGDDFFAMKEDVPHGAISQRHYYSKTLKRMRRLHVWTPAGFEKSKEQLPVFYLIHGGGDADTAWPTIGCAGNILDNLLAEGKIKPMLVVMPNGHFEIPKILDRVPVFMHDLMTDIIPFIEANYHVYTDGAHRAIMGLSLGGLQTLETVTSHCEDFGYIGVLSSGWWISDTWAEKRGVTDSRDKRAACLKDIADDFNKSVKLLYFTQGGPEDHAYENGMETMKLFDAAGIEYQYSESPGGHTWMVWRKNLYELAPLLFTDTPAQPSQVLDYLYSISGKKILAGQHNREPNAKPALWTDYIKKTTGKYPAFWSGDFLFQQNNIDNRWAMIHEAKRQWDSGAVVNLMWHACPPDQGEPCGWNPGLLNAQLDDDQWEELLTDGTPLNERWKNRMDDIAVYLQYLEDNGVEVLFRPLHEMNQGKFWWGGRPGPDGTAKLYRHLHDYFTKTRGLSNLVWVWDMQDMTRDFEQYNPGDDYWDVFAFDVYEKGFDSSWYEYILPIAGEKPMAIGECSKLPSSEMLASQPRWAFFMPWAELVKKANSVDAIQRIYDDPRVITRDEMPGWK